MGRWDDDESIERSKQQADEHFRRAKENWKKFTDRVSRDAERERAWLEILDELTSRPDALDNLSESELEYYLTQAEGEVEHFRGKLGRHRDTQGRLKSYTSGNELAGGLLDAISGFGSNTLNEQIRKNERLVRLIKAKQRAQQKALPKPTRAQELAQKVAEQEQEKQESITLLELQRDAQKKKYPDQADSIERRYRRMIEAILEDE